MLGSLIVSLGLDATDFISGMSKSEQQARRFTQNLDGAIAKGIVKAQIALEALGSAVRVSFETFQSLTVDAAAFKDLEESTGASAEGLASLAVAAATAGVPMDAVGDAANKLTKSLVGVDDESKAAGAALGALGLNVKEFKALDPVAQFQAVGKALEGFADGASKVAVAQALFGKSGAEQLKVFKALEEQGGRQIILTQRQIELSDAYADAQAKAQKQLQLYAQAAFSEALPAITGLTTAAADFAKELLGVDKNTAQLAANNGVAKWASDAVLAVGELIDIFQKVDRAFVLLNTQSLNAGAIVNRLAKGDFKAAVEIAKQSNAEIERITSAPLFSERLKKSLADAKAAASVAVSNASPLDARDARLKAAGPTTPDRPVLKFNGAADASKANAAADAAAREQRRILDGQLKDIRAFAEQQRDAFEFANRIVKATYEDGLTTLQQSFEGEREIRAQALQSTIAALDAEVRVLEEHARKAAKPEARIDAENKIAEAVARRSQALQRAQQDNVLSVLEESRALGALRDRYDELRATVLQLSGDSQGAASIRIAQQVGDARKLLAQSGQDQGLADTLGKRLTDTERLNRAQADYNSLVERARLSEESILLAARESGATELATMQAVGASRSAALRQMESMVATAQELAAVLGTDDARRYADGLAVAFQRSTAEASPLLLKIREVGEEAGFAIASGFEEAIVSGGNLRDILKGIEQDLVRIITRNLVTQRLGNFLSNAIGGNGAASGGGGLIGGLLGGVGGGLFGSLFGGGGAQLASGAFAGGSLAFTNGLSGLMFADGGRPPVGQASLVGEKGPELFVPDVAGKIIPHERTKQILQGMGLSDDNSLMKSFGGMFANGGSLAAGKWGIAGERGPELIRGPAHVVPSNRSMAMLNRAAAANAQPARGSGSLALTVHVQAVPGMTRQTAMQQGESVGRGISRAMARNG